MFMNRLFGYIVLIFQSASKKFTSLLDGSPPLKLTSLGVKHQLCLLSSYMTLSAQVSFPFLSHVVLKVYIAAMSWDIKPRTDPSVTLQKIRNDRVSEHIQITQQEIIPNA